MNRHDCLVSSVVQIDDNFLDQDARKPLFGSHCRTGGIPYRRQIVCQRNQTLSIYLRARDRIRIHPSESLFQLCNPLKGCVPARF
jgi:hypothetical protein